MALATMLCACSLTAPEDASLTGGAAPSGAVGAGCALGTKPCAQGCAAVDAPATGCGAASCSPCSFAHAQPLCIAGACAMGPCENGFADCDHDPTNGCEADLRRDTGRCGSCLSVCTSFSPVCEDGVCVPRCGAVKLLDGSARAFTKQGVAAEGDFTVELWLRWHGEFTASLGAVVLTTNELLPEDGLVLACPAAPTLQCLLSIPAGPGPVSAELVHVPIKAGVWHHLAFQRASGALVGFLDGVPGETVPSSSKVVATSGVALGRTNQVPAREAAPVSVGPVRFSTIARYPGPFTPRRFLASDESTSFSWLSSGAFDGATLVDASGHAMNAAVSTPGHLVLEPSPPCAP